MSKKQRATVHMIGHGHIDPVWLWRWTEGYEEVRATFRSAIDRMDETAAVKFTASSACFYSWVENAEPKLFGRIQERVREGRWEIAGGMWIEPDCNIPSGESFVRQGLHAQRYFDRAFGQRARIGFNPDSFGHAGMLPQILRKLGMEHYVYMRPMPVVEMDYPEGSTFWWESPDGSRVLTTVLLESYNADEEVVERIRRIAHSPHLNPGQLHVLGFFGVGNHGGGPTRRAIQALQGLQSDKHLPALRFSTLREYFEALDSAGNHGFPTIRTELQHHARGCYSANLRLKQLHRRTEHALLVAERFASAAWLLGAQPYPRDPLTLAWKDLLFNQFHDILAGTCIEAAYEDVRDQLGAARHRADIFRNQAAQSIARDINTSADGNTIVVFNPLAWPVTAPLTVPPIVEQGLDAPLHLVDDTEQPVPVQEAPGEYAGSRRHIFVAQVDAMGYRCYHARSGARALRLPDMLEATPTTLENDWWRIEFDGYTGEIARLYDKNHKVDVLRRGAVLAVLQDSSDTWSHGITEYRTEAGRFGNATLRVTAEGDVCATVRAVSSFHASRAIQEVTIYRQLPIVDITLRIEWREEYRVLKYTFDTHIVDGTATFESPYGHTVRPASGGEEPVQQWVDLTGQLDDHVYGLALLNDSTYGCDVRGGTMRATILRSPAYAHHDPARHDASLLPPIMDQGWHTVRFRLAPHAGPWEHARIEKQAWELNVPLAAHIESGHRGKRPTRATLMGTESDNILLTVLKQSEDGEDLIVRGCELHGEPVKTMLHLPFFQQSFELEFAPYEIKTLRISPASWNLREVNLLEE